MPLPIIADVSRVAVRGLCQNGQPWVNVLHFAKPTATSRAAFMTALDINIRGIYNPTGVSGPGTSGWATVGGIGSSAVDYTETRLDGVSASEIIALGITGAAGGDPLPADTALVSTFRTGFRGRSNRGRTYWAALTETNNDSNGQLLLANATEITANWAALLVSPGNLDAILCVASYLLADSNPVTSVTLNRIFDRQRRRKTS